MIKEISLGGVYVPPMVGYLLGTALVWWLVRYAIGQLGLYRFVWHPPLFNAALYVILLSAFVTATL